MSLNELRLPPIVIADLYRNALIATSPRAVVEQVTPGRLSKRVRFLGQNRRNVTVILHEPSNEAIPPARLDFLVKILAACQLTMEDAAIVNTAGIEQDFSGLLTELRPKYVLLFGNYAYHRSSPAENEYFTLKDVDGVKMLYIPEVKVLMEKSEEARHFKVRLWENLRQLFNV